MTGFTIKVETLAKRCEICHQLDCFNSDTNFCSRCANIELDGDDHLITERSSNHYANKGLIIGLIIGALSALINEVAYRSSFAQLSPWLVIFGVSMIGSIWGTMIGAGIENLHK